MTQSQLAPCDILCGSCPLGSGAAADSAASTLKHISDCQIPACSPLVSRGETINLCWKESINIFDRNISFS